MKALTTTRKFIAAAAALLILFAVVLPGCSNSGGFGVLPTIGASEPGEIISYETPEENIVRDEETGQLYADNEILLVASEKATYEDIRKLADQYGAEIKGWIEVTGDYQLVLRESKTEEELKELIDALNKSELVESATLNVFKLVSDSEDATNDSRWSGQWDENNPDGGNWGMEAIRCPAAWRVYDVLNKSPVNIGAVDVGFFDGHEDLRFTGIYHNENSNRRDHGSHVCGTLGAVYNNGVGVTGVYPSADGHLYASSAIGVRNTGKENQNNYLMSLAETKVVFAELILRNVKVINYSMGIPEEYSYAIDRNENGDYDAVRQSLRQEAAEEERFFIRLLEMGYDFLIVASAGNSSGLSYTKDSNEDSGYRITGEDASVTVSAEFNSDFTLMQDNRMRDRIVVVGNAKREKGWFSPVPYKRSSRSCVGDRVDVMAPGTEIESTLDGIKKYGKMSGTSMAAPHISGVAAMVWSLNNRYTGPEVKRILLESATTAVEDSSCSMINANAAVRLAATRSNQSIPSEIESTGTLIAGGYYRDENGKNIIVEGCRLSICKAGTDEIIDSHEADTDGVYGFILAPGEYDVVSEHEGYETGREERIRVTQSQVDYAAVYMREAVTAFSVPDSLTLTVGHLALIEPELTPDGAKGYTIRWTSSDPSVVTVNPTGEYGTLRGLKRGTAEITAELTSGGNTMTRTTDVRVTSQGRDTVLVLDVSGSMKGKPLTELKKSAERFCDDLLTDEYNNRVAIVCFNSQVTFRDFSGDIGELKSYIAGIRDNGSTNMSAGLQKAEELLDNGGESDHIKNIVIMADGMPNAGTTSYSGSAGITGSSASYANSVVDTARSIMKKYNMYSLGFFHSVTQSTYANCVSFMSKLTNMPDGYHEVTNAEDLQFEFGDIATDIADGSKIIINIACPVDVTVRYGDETLSSAEASFNDTTSFGKLEQLGAHLDVKVLSLDSDKEYDIDLRGTGEGTMDYMVNYMNRDDEIEDYRNFSSVPITNTTIINTNTDNSTTVNLNVDANGDGTVDLVYTADGNGEGKITVNTLETTAPPTEPTTPPTQQEDGAMLPVIIISICLIIAIGITVTLIAVAVSGNGKEPDYEIPLLSPDKPYAAQKSQLYTPAQPQKNAAPQPALSVEGKTVPLQRNAPDAVIEILTGSMKATTIPLKHGETVTLGKNPIVCSKPFDKSYETVSRRHCEIVYDGKRGMFYVTDLSKNGTFRTGNVRLPFGQRIGIAGGTILTLSDRACMVRLKVPER